MSALLWPELDSHFHAKEEGVVVEDSCSSPCARRGIQRLKYGGGKEAIDSVLYTRGGDRGETSLYGAGRVPKDSPRVDAYGTIDELNCCLGVALASCTHAEVSEPIRRIQADLFTAGADLATELGGEETARVSRIDGKDTRRLELMVDEFQEKLPKLTTFILPGGSETSSRLHHARAVCRRAERRIVALSSQEKINPELIPYFNRLSTYLFGLARYANLLEGVRDEAWKGRPQEG